MKYITLKGFGRWQLGNQIFQYLFLDLISKLTKRQIVFFNDKEDKLKKEKIRINTVFNVNLEFLDFDENLKFKDIIEKSFYDKNIINEIISDDTEVINLIGFFQSYKYFKHEFNLEFNLQNKINQLFGFDDKIKQEGNIIIENIHNINQDKTLNLVSIHVRRGDYIKYDDYHVILPMIYYINAIRKIEKEYNDVYYVVCSDDINWCKRVFYFIKDKAYFSENNKDIVDMYLMSQCSIKIISNSSFSLLTCYFNRENKGKKLNICPSIWFGNKKINFNLEDIYHESLNFCKI